MPKVSPTPTPVRGDVMSDAGLTALRTAARLRAQNGDLTQFAREAVTGAPAIEAAVGFTTGTVAAALIRKAGPAKALFGMSVAAIATTALKPSDKEKVSELDTAMFTAASSFRAATAALVGREADLTVRISDAWKGFAKPAASAEPAAS